VSGFLLDTNIPSELIRSRKDKEPAGSRRYEMALRRERKRKTPARGQRYEMR